MAMLWGTISIISCYQNDKKRDDFFSREFKEKKSRLSNRNPRGRKNNKIEDKDEEDHQVPKLFFIVVKKRTQGI